MAHAQLSLPEFGCVVSLCVVSNRAKFPISSLEGATLTKVPWPTPALLYCSWKKTPVRLTYAASGNIAFRLNTDRFLCLVTLTFWPQNKWVFRTHRETCFCQVWWSSLHWFMTYLTEKQTDKQRWNPYPLPSRDCRWRGLTSCEVQALKTEIGRRTRSRKKDAWSGVKQTWLNCCTGVVAIMLIALYRNTRWFNGNVLHVTTVHTEFAAVSVETNAVSL